jgi:light-regulated signal transduction histidine kinase (bacteriophytochrome)
MDDPPEIADIDDEELGKRLAMAQQMEALRQSNESLQHFAYVASHDLQEPLRVVANYLRLLERRSADKLDEQSLRYLHTAVTGAERMKELIYGLLAFSRVGSNAAAFADVPLNEVIEQALANLSLALKDVKGKVTVNGQAHIVYGDQTQLVQLVQNLLGNALKFRTEEPPRITVETEISRTHWIVSVTDNGIGIAKEDCGRVFEIFQRLHSQDRFPGSGMGLAICRRIVEHHGGTIQAMPRKDGKCGTCVCFTISRLINGPAGA